MHTKCNYKLLCSKHQQSPQKACKVHRNINARCIIQHKQKRCEPWSSLVHKRIWSTSEIGEKHTLGKSNNFWNPQTKFLKPQNRKYVTLKSKFLKPKDRKYVTPSQNSWNHNLITNTWSLHNKVPWTKPQQQTPSGRRSFTNQKIRQSQKITWMENPWLRRGRLSRLWASRWISWIKFFFLVVVLPLHHVVFPTTKAWLHLLTTTRALSDPTVSRYQSSYWILAVRWAELSIIATHHYPRLRAWR